MHHVGTALRVEMQERLGIGGRAEARTIDLEFCAQLRIIVDFAVEYDDETSVFTGHRLGSAVGKIDDRKPSMPESAMSVHAPPSA